MLPNIGIRPTSLEIDSHKRDSYKFFREGDFNWKFDSFFFPYSNYDESLPKIDGKNVEQIINNLILKAGEKRKMMVLDIGCWNAVALAQMAGVDNWRGKLSLHGITAQDPMADYRLNGEIKIVIADAQELKNSYPQAFFDLIMSKGSLGCMVDQMEVLSQMWDLLSVGGVALVSDGYWESSRSKEIEKINSWLQKKNFAVKLFLTNETRTNFREKRIFRQMQVTMVKNKEETLVFPVAPAGFVRHDPDYPEILTYDYLSPSSLSFL